MIEIQANSEMIISFFKSLNYRIYNDMMSEIITLNDFENIGTPNIFFFP